jgi:hypothetical protein
MNKFSRCSKSGELKLLLVGIASTFAIAGGQVQAQEEEPLVLKAQGSFSVGGRIVTGPGTFDATIPGAGSRNDGQEFRIDGRRQLS